MKHLLVTRNLSILTTTLLLAACSSMHNSDTRTSQKDKQIDNQLAQLESQQQELNRQQTELNRLKQQTAMNDDSLLPPINKPGHCYARVFVEPVYEDYQERVLISEASHRIEIVPARFEMAEERVLVSEASERIEAIPASYKWVEEQVLVKPKSSRMIEIPASYKMETEEVLVRPAHTVWKKGTGPLQRIDQATGEIMCLVEVPAQYKTVSTRVIDKPATTRLMEEPAVYKTVKKQVIDRPASTRTISIPAKYSTMKVNKQLSAAKENRIDIPAKYNTINKTRMTKDGHMAWREILCDTNMTHSRITQIQTSLKMNGFNPGPIDGVVGRETMQAVNAFQKANKLPVDQYLNVKTVEALGIKAQ